MLLGDLFQSANIRDKKIPIKDISFDSRKVKKGDIFFAIKGTKVSGIKFINEALLNGASVIVSYKKIRTKKKIPIIIVKDVRKSLAKTCSKFYKKKPLKIIAVTGTNGKSSVVNFFYQILNLNQVSAATIGTLGIFSKKYKKKINLTSVDPISLHKNLAILANNNVKNVILEASSHGLKQKRLDYVNFNTGIFTNLSHDHLDYHKNMKEYFNSKLYLFQNLLKKKSTIITDEENKEFNILKKIAIKKNIKLLTIGKNAGNLKILENKYEGDKQLVKISINSKIIDLEIPLIGYFQVTNLLLAAVSALNCGLSENNIFKKIKKIKSIPGRLECISNIKGSSKVVVDFAHTPDALEQSLIALKKQFRKDVIIVFGCGGERDKKKRIRMGRIAGRYCRKIFVTDDNPRNENPLKIRNEIMKGCKKNSVNIANRRIAIKTAINELRPNEILLVAGKGHEEYQDYGKKIFNFSDKKEIKKIIKNKKFHFPKNYFESFLLRKNFANDDIKNINYKGVSINTKTLKKNDLFFAIKVKKNDGHKFISDAIKKGASKIIISKQIKKINTTKIIKTKNTFSSLNNLAKLKREYTAAQIIGITGSVGKTTLKNLVGFALKNYGKIHQSPHSYNNKFGVPLSVSNLKEDTKYGIFEIGMDKKGEIDYLSKIVKPQIAVITNISNAHLKNFNSVNDIAKAKSEIINNISEGGKIILNKDDKFFNYFETKAKKKGIKIFSFGYNKKADISFFGVKKNKSIYKLKIIIDKRPYYFNIKYNTKSFIINILACVSILYGMNLDLTKLEKQFTKFSIPSGRGDIKKVRKFNKVFKFIDESYNANSLSMVSAINNLNSQKRNANSKKIVFLGDMLELGKKTKMFHKELSFIINKSDIDEVYVYGKHIKETYNNLNTNKKGKIFDNLKQAYDHFGKIIHNNDILMVKGSNATGLNSFSKKIKKGQISAI